MNPYHFSEISRNKNNKHFQLWLKAVQAKYDGLEEPFKGGDFDQILWNYDVRSHFHISFLCEELGRVLIVMSLFEHHLFYVATLRILNVWSDSG